MSTIISSMKAYQPSDYVPEKNPYISNCHYEIVVHTYSTMEKQVPASRVFAEWEVTKEGTSKMYRNRFEPVTTDIRNALQQMETFAYHYVINVDGVERSNKCLYKEERFLRKVKSLPQQCYITRNAKEFPNSLTVWRKHKVAKIVPGWVWGETEQRKTKIEKLFTVSIVKIDRGILDREDPAPTIVVNEPKWYDELVIPKGMSAEKYFENERIDCCHEYVSWLKSIESFKKIRAACDKRCEQLDSKFYNGKKIIKAIDRNDGLDKCNIGLPQIRYECNANKPVGKHEFHGCPRAVRWTPPPAPKPITPKAPPAPKPMSKEEIKKAAVVSMSDVSVQTVPKKIIPLDVAADDNIST